MRDWTTRHIAFFTLAFGFAALLGPGQNNAQAQIPAVFDACTLSPVAQPPIIAQHQIFVGPYTAQPITTLPLAIQQRFNTHSIWVEKNVFAESIEAATPLLADQMSAISMIQSTEIGKMFDAQIFMDTQQTEQVLRAEAYRDYSPSQEFCVFGTGARAMAASDSKRDFTKAILDQTTLARKTGQIGTSAADGTEQDQYDRWRAFTQNYCDTRNNSWQQDRPQSTGLTNVCETSVTSGRVNRDVDYARLIDEPRTIPVNFNAPVRDGANAGLETDIFAFLSNVIGHQTLNNALDLNSEGGQEDFLKRRAVMARRSVAQNSMNAILALKASGSDVGSVPRILGVSDQAVLDMVGQDPSLYAQLEMLSKKLYQNPDFYAGLYDKPANVERTAVAMRAIELMIDREIYNSRLRQEMLGSVLLSTKLDQSSSIVEAISSQ